MELLSPVLMLWQEDLIAISEMLLWVDALPAVFKEPHSSLVSFLIVRLLKRCSLEEPAIRFKA